MTDETDTETPAASTPTEWVIWCHLHRHYVLTTDGPAPTWTYVPGDARTFTRNEAHAVANGTEWLGHEATPWARPALSAELAP